MIERLVFISTMVLFLMIGVNGFLLMGNQLCQADGTRLNIIGSSTLPCGTLDSTQMGLGFTTMISDANSISQTNTSISSSTQAPGSAQSVTNFFWGSVSAAWLGINWIKDMLTAGIILGAKMAGLVPFLSPLIYVFVAIIAALEGFALMYWTMAGARAILGRFL